MFSVFLGIDFLKMRWEHSKLDKVYRSKPRGTMFTTPGFEALGALAQDGGEPYEEVKDSGAKAQNAADE